MLLIFFGLIAVFLPPISGSTCPSGNFNQSIIVDEGQSVILECYAGGETNVPVKWHREPLKNSTNQNIILPTGEIHYNGNVLNLSSITRHQRGIYICSVDDKSRSYSRYIQVIVNFKPIIIDAYRIRHFGRHELQLRCNAESQPPAEIRWFKNDHIWSWQTDMYSEIITNREFDDTLNSTLIESFHLYNNSNYECEIGNRLGKVHVRFGIVDEYYDL